MVASARHEFALRLAGVSYEEVARAGGGIVSSVRATRAPARRVVRQPCHACKALMAEGVRHHEIKSGTAWPWEHERKQLRAWRAAWGASRASRCTTFLPHVPPPEYTGRSQDYIDHLVPADAARAARRRPGGRGGRVASARLHCRNRSRCLPPPSGWPARQAARRQLSDMGGAHRGALPGAVVRPHRTPPRRALPPCRRFGTVAVLPPGAYWHPCATPTCRPSSTSAAGVPMAVSTDHNPGTSPALSQLLLMANMACTLFRLTVP